MAGDTTAGLFVHARLNGDGGEGSGAEKQEELTKGGKDVMMIMMVMMMKSAALRLIGTPAAS